MTKWRRILFQPCEGLGENHSMVTGSSEHIGLSRKAACEGTVLLKNENSILPVGKEKIVLLGKACIDYVKGGGGSGDVNCSYVRNLYEGLLEKESNDQIEIYHPLAKYYKEYVEAEYRKNCVPGLIEEPKISVSQLQDARSFSSVAVLSISRFSGENWDRLVLDGEDNLPFIEKAALASKKLFPVSDFYLSKNEKELIDAASSLFDSIIVVLNIGGPIETKWIKENPKIKAALLSFQGGMEGGGAEADLLCGDAVPSGKLTDTYADTLFAYPGTDDFHHSNVFVEYNEDIFIGYRYFYTIRGKERHVTYPFGFGLSYTTFQIKDIVIEHDGLEFFVTYAVKNTGIYQGKEVIQLYCQAPQGMLGKPRFQLVGFRKTSLLDPGAEEKGTITFKLPQIASYDDVGIIQMDSFVLEKGRYTFFLGNSLDSLEEVKFAYGLEKNLIIERLHDCLPPMRLTKRLHANGVYTTSKCDESCVFDNDVLERQNYNLLEGMIPNGKVERQITRQEENALSGKKLRHCNSDKKSIDAFVSGLSDDDLIALACGQPNTGVANTYGFGNSFIHGIPNVMTADGPAGLRINKECGLNTTAWPCATALASTWNVDLVYEVAIAAGSEVKENNIGVWLAPGVNIHRNPICGRNFEYYSEDPYLAGMIGIAMVEGIQANGIGACVKHFALNNKETNRKESDSIVSKRAIREIYLKPFEMIVKNANPFSIMSSYNLINGRRAAENKDLLTAILREEWHFSGIVFSDWWNHSEHYLELLAGENIKMGCGYPERLKEAMDKGLISRADMERNASHIVNAILRLE